MPQPLRKVRQRIPAASRQDDGPAPRVLFHLPPLALMALVVIFAAAVGWAFFMGVVIGKGQNPEERVSALLSDPPQQEAAAEDGARQPLLDSPLLPEGAAAPAAAQSAQAAQAPQAAPQDTAAAADGQNAGKEAAPQAGSTPADKTTAAAKPTYPFARPQGESLAAWGISPDSQKARQASPQADRPATATRAPAANREATPPAEPLFDYVYQVAAFRDKEDADRLRKTLNGHGMRARVIKSGKVQLVLVMLRGTERDAENLRQEMENMGLGTPLRTSKKPVTPRGGKRR